MLFWSLPYVWYKNSWVNMPNEANRSVDKKNQTIHLGLEMHHYDNYNYYYYYFCGCCFFNNGLNRVMHSRRTHRLITYTDTKAKCRHQKNWPIREFCGRCLSEFIDWRFNESVMLVFSTQLCELLSLWPSLWFNSSPPFPFPVWISTGWQR